MVLKQAGGLFHLSIDERALALGRPAVVAIFARDGGEGRERLAVVGGGGGAVLHGGADAAPGGGL